MNVADRGFMGLALALARQGSPAPNPHVGAVVVRDGKVVGVGHHERAGQQHAEPVALARAGELAHGRLPLACPRARKCQQHLLDLVARNDSGHPLRAEHL